MIGRILGQAMSRIRGLGAAIHRRYSNFALPLLTKELIEQANRLRTYIVRMLYATVVFFVAMLSMQRLFTQGQEDVFAVLGQGRELFQMMVYLSFGGIYLFMPAISADAITLEKERDSLSLLFLTKLTPWTIVLEKLFVRMVAMLSFLLTILPLLALTYSLGGISSDYLIGGMVALLLATLQVGAVSILCSSFCRTTVAAFVLTYILLTIINLGFLTAAAPLLWGFGGRGGAPSDVLWFVACLFTPPMMFTNADQLPLWAYLLLQLPSLLVSLVALLFARVFLESRAFVPRKYYFRRFLQMLDKMFFALNDNKVTKGIILVGDRAVLPDTEPIAWRETTRRSLGQFRYLVRIFVVLELPVAILCLIGSGTEEPNSGLLGVVEPMLWLFGVVLIAVSAAGLIPSERTRESLEVLMTTPLSGREIVRQKMAGISRLTIVAAVPILTVILTGAALQVVKHQGVYTGSAADGWSRLHVNWGTLYFPAQIEFPWLFALGMTSCVALYLPLTAWLSMYIGLHVNSQAKAIPAALAAIIMWCAVPCFFAIVPEIMFGGPANSWSIPFILCLSPVGFPGILHTEFLGQPFFTVRALWLFFLVNTSIYGGLLFFLRRRILSHADRYLKRGDGTSVAPSGEPEVIRAALSPAAGA